MRGSRCVRRETSRKRSTSKRKESIKIYIPSMKTLARNACPPGMIERKGYVRKYSNNVRKRGFTVRRNNGTTYRVYPKNQSMRVNSSCIKNTGKPGKGVPRSIGPLRKGELSKHGYSFRLNKSDRHEALRRAIEDYGELGVYRKLDAVAKLTKLTVPEASSVYKMDRDWVHSKYSLKQAKSA